MQEFFLSLKMPKVEEMNTICKRRKILEKQTQNLESKPSQRLHKTSNQNLHKTLIRSLTKANANCNNTKLWN
jgi:hypothetical protein